MKRMRQQIVMTRVIKQRRRTPKKEIRKTMNQRKAFLVGLLFIWVPMARKYKWINFVP